VEVWAIEPSIAESALDGQALPGERARGYKASQVASIRNCWWALPLFAANTAGVPPVGTNPATDDPIVVAVPPPMHRTVNTSPAIPGLGPRLARRIREGGLDRTYRFIARDLPRSAVEAAGGVVTSEIGSISSGVATGRALRILAPLSTLLDAPQPLKPLLDKSRVDIHADRADRGDGFTSRYRGAGAIIADYDSGVDLMHPDLRALDGPTRVVALWDQDLAGTPPPGKSDGHVCTKDVLTAGTCASRDKTGHGTLVLSVAASGGPGYRGIAPEASLAMAASSEYELFLDTLDWFRNVAIAEDLPLVVNLSLGGHEGPHDGTSLEAQAIDALEHLVVAAAGNDGLIPVHSLVRLDKGDFAVVALRFPVLPEAIDRRAIVEIWGDVGLPLSAQAQVIAPGGQMLAETASVTIGDPGMTAMLMAGTATLGRAMLDPEASLNPFNGQPHIRIELELYDWEDAPGGPGFAAITLRGEGRVDLWVDSPPTEPAPIRFDRERVLEIDRQALGDADHTISDPATAVSAVAVGAYTTRVEFENMAGEKNTVGGTLGAIASFTSWGPTISPATTGDKPDISAPGHVVIGARSATVPMDSATVSPLYRAGAGTSLAAPHVSGTVALLLGAKPELAKAELKQIVLRSAIRDEQVEESLDPRWGAGRLDAAAALAMVVEADQGCGCHSAAPANLYDMVLISALPLLYRWRRRRRSSSA
jgi:subtilisin family serine protease